MLSALLPRFEYGPDPHHDHDPHHPHARLARHHGHPARVLSPVRNPEPLEVMQNKTELAPPPAGWPSVRARCWVTCSATLACPPAPPLSVPMKALAGHDEFYLHDPLSRARHAGLGVGQRLLSRALAFASHADIAMQAWWRFRMPPPSGASGFVPADTGKSLVEYGDGAVYMRLPPG